jgi:hypothetical protein
MPKKQKATTSRASNLQAAKETLSVKWQKSMPVDPVAVIPVEREADCDDVDVILVCPEILNGII